MQKVRILLDARKIGDGGIGAYVEHLATGLARHPGVDLTLLVLPRRKQSVTATLPESVATTVLDAPPYSLAELRLGRRVDWGDFDLFHTPHFVLPFGVPVPQVVTIHDAIYCTHPTRWFQPPIARLLMRSAMKRASAVITVSESAARTIAEVTGIRRSAAVIGNCLDPAVVTAAAQASVTDGQRRIVAVVSSGKRHKGVHDLLRAWRRVDEKLRAGFTLTLVGKGACTAPQLDGVEILADGVELLGEVERSQLLKILKGCSAVVVPSLEEGFCITALDAQALGKPLITRPVPAVLELLPQRAASHVVAADFSVAALTEALTSYLRDPVAVVPTEHLVRFSRERFVEAHCAVYAAALGWPDAFKHGAVELSNAVESLAQEQPCA